CGGALGAGAAEDAGVASAAPEQQTFNDGWANYQRLLLDSLRDLTADQLLVRPAPNMWAVWQLGGHMAASRTYWFHDILGEGDPPLPDLFRVQSTLCSPASSGGALPRSAPCSAPRARPAPGWRSRTPPGRPTRIPPAGPP